MCGALPASFNPRPREGATTESPNRWRAMISFNPRPREGATSWKFDLKCQYKKVSIHAPVKGRHQRRRCHRCPYQVSIHAPVKGRPIPKTATDSLEPRFNPRPREGATKERRLSPLASGCFNPRPREGATFLETCWKLFWLNVSIHAPVKGRLELQRSTFRLACFNPRPREGATTIRKPAHSG